MTSDERDRIRRVVSRFTRARLPRDPRELAGKLKLTLRPVAELPEGVSLEGLDGRVIAFDSAVHPNDQCVLIARGIAMHLRQRFAGSILVAFKLDALGEALYPTLCGNRGRELVIGRSARRRV